MDKIKVTEAKIIQRLIEDGVIELCSTSPSGIAVSEKMKQNGIEALVSCVVVLIEQVAIMQVKQENNQAQQSCAE